MFAYLGVPVLAGEVCLGALAVATTDMTKRFTLRDQELLEALARQAGIAIQNARLYSQLQNELAERGRVEMALRQREAILEAVATAAGQFLQSQDWPRYIQTVLAELGQITHSSHTYIFQNHPGPQGRAVTTQLYQWTAPQAEPTLGRAEFQNVPLEGAGLERWREAMLRGEPYYGSHSTWQPDEVHYLGPLGAQSILEMPVYLPGAPGNLPGEAAREWWGLIGFDDYTAERVWSPAEVDAIKIAAGILSAAIQRQRADQAVQQREDLYRRAIGTADAVPYYYQYAPPQFSFIGEGILKLTGYPAAEMTPDLWNQHVEQAIPKGEASGLTEDEALQLSRQGKLPDWRCDYRFRRQDGELCWIADTGIELMGADGESHGCIGILQDITDRKLAEEAARQANLVLEKRVQERTAALQLANKEMEAFTYSVSHDLRAPLRAIDGYSRILLEDYGERLNADGQTCLNNVRQSAKKMNQLIDDLLQFSRATRQAMEMVPVSLSDLADELLEAHARQEADRVVQVTVQPGLETAGDPNLLRIAIENLISNAWKFTRQTANARIEVGQVPQSETMQPVYYVRDNGAGFDMQYAYRLFQPFQRLHSPEEFEGTGVGLATVQRIISRHNGQVWAEGIPNQGACFYFTIGQADE